MPTKIPNKIGICIAIAIGFVFLIVFNSGGAWAQGRQAATPELKNDKKNKANGTGNANANFDWYFLVGTFVQNGLAPSSLAQSSLFRNLSNKKDWHLAWPQDPDLQSIVIRGGVAARGRVSATLFSLRSNFPLANNRQPVIAKVTVKAAGVALVAAP